MMDNELRKLKIRGRINLSEYIFKIKKGELEIELSSDDAKFIEEQLEKWREDILKVQDN